MPEEPSQLKSQIVDLAGEALESFCEDMSGMFGVEMSCEQLEVHENPGAAMKKSFKKLAAVYSVQPSGALSNDFNILIDKAGLFTITGVVVMLPKSRVLSNAKRGTAEEANEMADAVGEVGNLLVGSWDRCFREGLEDDTHLVHSGTFIGDPNADANGVLDPKADSEATLITFEMSVGEYPEFKCGVYLPSNLFDVAETVESDTPDTSEQVVEEVTSPEPEEAVAAEAAESKQPSEPKVSEPSAKSEPTPEKETVEEAPAPVAEAEEIPEPKAPAPAAETEPAPAEEKPKEVPAPVAESEKIPEPKVPETPPVEAEAAPADVTPEKAPAPAADPVAAPESKAPESPPVEAETAPADETPEKAAAPAAEPVAAPESKAPDAPPVEVEPVSSEAAPSPIPEPSADEIFAQAPPREPGPSVLAKALMQTQVHWISGDETVDHAQAKMQETGSSYLLVGSDSKLEGIITRSDLAGAASIYLRPIFAKWRRAEDEATLQIRIKWIMSKQIYSVKPETPLFNIVHLKCKYDISCLPVVDVQGHVLGVVTTKDVLKDVINKDLSSLGVAVA